MCHCFLFLPCLPALPFPKTHILHRTECLLRQSLLYPLKCAFTSKQNHILQGFPVLLQWLKHLFNVFLSSYAAHNWVSAEIGREAVLSCPNISEVPLLVIWKRNRTSCLSYRRDLNKTSSLNCSERITWKYSPGRDPALRIYPVDLEDEGIYTCDLVNAEGNFQLLSSLIVIVPPTVTLTHDKSRVAVCQASAGKPAADISWIPASNHSSEEEFHHPNGTVTRVSYFGWANSSIPSVTCLVTHAAPKLDCLWSVCFVSREACIVHFHLFCCRYQLSKFVSEKTILRKKQY
uniref:Ig-like domain-containing protein n=1 Tax=Zonotrichia albicollis TaxID=44394 RepID=A0A8D2N7J5_ZONAL